MIWIQVTQLVKNPPAKAEDTRSRFDAWVRRIVSFNVLSFLLFQHKVEQTPGYDGEQKNMMSFSPWGCEESDTSKWLKKRHAHSCIGQQFGQLFQKGFENFPLAPSKQVWRALIYHFPIKTITNCILVYLHLFISFFQLHEEDTIFLLFCRKIKWGLKTWISWLKCHSQLWTENQLKLRWTWFQLYTRYCCCLITKSCPILLHLLWPSGFPGKNTGVGCHFLLQGIFQGQWLNLQLLPHLLHCRQIPYAWATEDEYTLNRYLIFFYFFHLFLLVGG